MRGSTLKSHKNIVSSNLSHFANKIKQLTYSISIWSSLQSSLFFSNQRTTHKNESFKLHAANPIERRFEK
jgi:hypothetical protein